jgi:hypothetical protein
MSNQPMIFQELNIASKTNVRPTKFEFLDPHLLGTSPPPPTGACSEL